MHTCCILKMCSTYSTLIWNQIWKCKNKFVFLKKRFFKIWRYFLWGPEWKRPNSLLPSGSPFGDPGPHGDLFQFLGPQKVPIFFQGPHFLYFRLKNALKVRASTIILVICILKGEFSETHLFNENGTNLCTKWSHILWRCFSIILLLCISKN